MGAGFECFDTSGNLQFTSEAEAYMVVTNTSIALTNVSNSFGRAIISLSNPSDLVAFRSSTAINMSGFRSPTTYTIYSQSLTGTINYKILRPFSATSAAADTMGLQLFSATGDCIYSALQPSVFIYGAVSVSGTDTNGDVSNSISTGTGTNPYALIIGNEFNSWSGDNGVPDTFERAACITSTTSDTIYLGNSNKNDWPGAPTGGGISYPGTYTVAAVY